jgi:hypothetical protein
MVMQNEFAHEHARCQYGEARELKEAIGLRNMSR